MRDAISKFIMALPEDRPLSIIELRVIKVDSKLAKGEELTAKDLKTLALAGIK